MLLTLMGNLGMFGGNIPPPPSGTHDEDIIFVKKESGIGKIKHEEEIRKANIMVDDENILNICKIFVECQSKTV